MNPPSALQSAMGRERKPFTYTPGGLNLSEIKSERMAKRLMRNAMNEGVAQTPIQNIQSPTTPTTPLNVPNYNCLPVQVFPAFSLPSNPKSLLRTRSTPQQKGPPPAFQPQNSTSTLPSTGSALYRQNNDAQNHGVVNNSGVNRGASLYTQMPSYINPAPQNEPPKLDTYSTYQFDTFQPCNDAVFMDTRTDIGQQPAPMYSNENNPVQCQDTVTRRVVPPFQYNPTPQSYDEARENSNDGIDTESKYSLLSSYNSATNTNSMSQKPSNLYEFNTTSNNSSQESYKTIESDGEQPRIVENSNFPSYINPPQIELLTTIKPVTAIKSSAITQVDTSESEFQCNVKDKVLVEDQQATTNKLYNEEIKKATEVPFELKALEANVCIQPLQQGINFENKPKHVESNADNQVVESNTNLDIEPKISMAIKDNLSSTNTTLEDAADDKSEVKVVKKVKKEKQTEESKRTENGEESETALTVKLPTKKSAAKTETKVEVKQKVLPDGTIEETKKTITKTTIDGRTEISTRTETRTIPKDEQDEEEEEVEEEEEEEIDDGEVVIEEVKQNGGPQNIISNGQATIVQKEQRSETTTTKNIVVSHNNAKEQEEEEEEVVVEEEEEIEEIPEKKEEKPVEAKPQPPVSKPPPKPVEVESEEEVEEEEEEQVVEQTIQLKKSQAVEETKIESEKKSENVIVDVEEKKVENSDAKKEIEVDEEEEEYEEAEEKLEEDTVKVETKSEPEAKPEPAQKEEEDTEEDLQSEDEAPKKEPIIEAPEPKETPKQEEPKQEPKEVPIPEPNEEVVVPTPVPEPKKEAAEPPKPIEIPIHFDKVDDIEIKPIGPQESITKTEKTEITTSKDCDGSTKTEMHRIENVVVSNRVTKTLDQSYEQLTQGLPTMKTYFAPSRERVDLSPAKAYQPTYQPPEPATERRHSLLLERLSMERQVPSPGQYQNQTYSSYNSNQIHETQRDWSQEPQSEVVNVSNVKPSTITKNQQWYQNKNENVIYNNLSQTPAPQQWSQPPPQQQFQAPAPPQPQYQAPPPPQPQFQVPAQPVYQAQHQPPQPSPQAQTYTDSYSQHYAKDTQSTYQQNSYPTYTPQSTSWGSNNVDSSANTNQYSYQNDQKSTQQQYSSAYVPPPWEQDPSYVAPPTNTTTTYFQPSPQTNEFQSNNSVPGWKPAPPAAGKFTKPAPKAYVPPAPNQSFVMPVSVSEPPRNIPGRKTYYSEYERRYISVPESNYVPGESKYQPSANNRQQPDPSPQYYYDNDEVPEKVEPEWRRELREFTEKTSQTYSSDQGTQSQYQSQAQTQYQTEQGTQSQYQSQYQTETSRPPWESDAQYAKTPAPYTPTPTWSQTLRPNSGRERTFESDYVSQTSTLGRRPVSYVEANSNPLPGRSRGVSVDRYNPSSYRSPIPTEHSPVQSHTLNPATAPPPKIYHNPSVPTYHSRASAEPREQPAPYPQPRNYAERASPLQSRSFKYLQWITGTDE